MKQKEGTPDESARFGILSPYFTIYTGDQGAKIVPASGHLSIENCTRIYLRFLRSPSWWGGGSKPPPQDPHRASALHASAPHLRSPEKKSCGRPLARWIDLNSACEATSAIRLYAKFDGKLSVTFEFSNLLFWTMWQKRIHWRARSAYCNFSEKVT